MVTFLFEEKERFTYDFELTIANAIEYLNWYYNEKEYDLKVVNSFDNIGKENNIPVGSIDFVHKFYKEVWGLKDIKPINIPSELEVYANRRIWRGTEKEEIKDRVFCKSDDRIKGYTDIVDKRTKLEEGNYLFSEVIEIDSEWRCFVLRGKLLSVHNYINSLGLHPNIETIREMIKRYDKLDAYTIDIGVNKEGTFIIEVHDFYSCGLYGYSNATKIVQMLIASHKQKTEKRG